MQLYDFICEYGHEDVRRYPGAKVARARPRCPRGHVMKQNWTKKLLTVRTEDQFQRRFSVTDDVWINTRSEEKAREKKLEAEGWSHGPRRNDDKPQSRADQKRSKEIARYGPAAMEHHRKRSQSEARKKKTKSLTA